jgi:hypothetical protein
VTAPAAAEIQAFCFAKCRMRQTYRRLLASRPVYACQGCGGTREIEELGSLPRLSAPPAALSTPERTYRKTASARAPRRTTPKEIQIMPKPKDSPLVIAIKKVVAENGGGITEDRVREIVREEILAQLPGDDAAAAEEAATSGLTHPKVTGENCPRMPHKGKHGKKCVAALEAAS